MGGKGQDQQDSHDAGHTGPLQTQGSNEERRRGSVKKHTNSNLLNDKCISDDVLPREHKVLVYSLSLVKPHTQRQR